jgi:hypothetical protein
MQAIEVLEIRARRDRNRLLGTYDPLRRVLRLFHRGETVTVTLPPPDDCALDVEQNQE